MVEAVILCALALIMGEIYTRTKHPKLYALLNTAAGVGCMLLAQFCLNGTIRVNSFNGAVSGILGVPGAILCAILQIGG